MIRTLLKSKIHRATITDTDLNYEGSLGVDVELLKRADIVPYELVQIYNVNTGERFETYVIEEAAGSGRISLRGAAARKGSPGDLIIIVSYAPMDDKNLENFKPAIILLDKNNRIKEEK